jgi:hypothetical protein
MVCRQDPDFSAKCAGFGIAKSVKYAKLRLDAPRPPSAPNQPLFRRFRRNQCDCDGLMFQFIDRSSVHFLL